MTSNNFNLWNAVIIYLIDNLFNPLLNDTTLNRIKYRLILNQKINILKKNVEINSIKKENNKTIDT